MKITLLRVLHGLFAVYFILCLLYMYYVAFAGDFGPLLWIAVASLGLEGFVVFVLNNGDCPLIHVQRRVGDNTPFFELFFPPRIAKQAIPFFARLTWGGVAILIVSMAVHYILL